MLLYLMRHEKAFDRADPMCPPDPERPLTAKGRRKTEAVVRGLVRLDIRPDQIITSPYTRARETAEIAQSLLDDGQTPMHESLALTPSSEPGLTLARLREIDADAVLAVGHLPNLDLVLARALGLDWGAVTHLKKAGVAALEVGRAIGERARLLWLMSPRVLAELGS